MKKQLLFGILQLFIICISAQTTVDTAIPLQEGKNAFTFENAEGQNSVYYVYTAPAEQSKLLTIVTSGPSTSIQLSEDGTYQTLIRGIVSGTTQIFPIRKGQKVYVCASVYKELMVEFTATLKDADISGSTCEEAITATEEEFFVPSYYDAKTYQAKSVYLSYSCSEDGLLEMKFGGYTNLLKISEGCDGNKKDLQAVSVGSTYIAKYQVEAGKDYIIELQLYSPIMASFKLTHPVEGASCDMPFAANDNENILPKEAGKYWYQYVAAKTGFMLITSENGLPGGNISIYKSCYDYSPIASINGYFSLRCKVEANVAYLICIEKTEATDTEVTFNLNVEEPKAGDSFDMPIEITEGIQTVPQYNGTYYYKITVPEGNSRFLVVDGKEANLKNNDTKVMLYRSDNIWTPLAQEKDYIKSEVTGGTSYFIVWACNEGMNAFPFKVAYEEIAQGDICSNPLPAQEGVNDLSVGTAKYYRYQATKTGWLCIDTDITIGVSFPRDCSQYSGEYDATKMAMTTKMEAVTGTDYLIKFTGIEEATTFTLSEEEYQEGESCEMAIPVEEGSTALPQSVLNRWYKYTVTKDGMLTISSDIVYEQSSDHRKSSMVSFKEGDCSAYPVSIIKSNSEGSYFEGEVVVRKDETIYMNIITVTAQANKNLTISLRDLKPGEGCSFPLLLQQGEMTLLEASRNIPVWYTATLEEGDFSISSPSAFTMYLYKDCDATTSLAGTQYYYDGDNPEYKLDYTVTEEASYIFKLEMSYPNTVVWISGSAIPSGLEKLRDGNPIRTDGNSIVIMPDTPQTHIEIYDITGKKIVADSINDITTFTVQQGIYIVKVNGYAYKIVVNNLIF